MILYLQILLAIPKALAAVGKAAGTAAKAGAAVGKVAGAAKAGAGTVAGAGKAVGSATRAGQLLGAGKTAMGVTTQPGATAQLLSGAGKLSVPPGTMMTSPGAPMVMPKVGGAPIPKALPATRLTPGTRAMAAAGPVGGMSPTPLPAGVGGPKPTGVQLLGPPGDTASTVPARITPAPGPVGPAKPTAITPWHQIGAPQKKLGWGRRIQDFIIGPESANLDPGQRRRALLMGALNMPGKGPLGMFEGAEAAAGRTGQMNRADLMRNFLKMRAMDAASGGDQWNAERYSAMALGAAPYAEQPWPRVFHEPTGPSTVQDRMMRHPLAQPEKFGEEWLRRDSSGYTRRQQDRNAMIRAARMHLETIRHDPSWRGALSNHPFFSLAFEKHDRESEEQYNDYLRSIMSKEEYHWYGQQGPGGRGGLGGFRPPGGEQTRPFQESPEDTRVRDTYDFLDQRVNELENPQPQGGW